MLNYIVLAIAAIAAIVGAAISAADKKHEKTQFLWAFAVIQIILLGFAGYIHHQDQSQLRLERAAAHELADRHAAQLTQLQASHDRDNAVAKTERKTIGDMLLRSELSRDELQRRLDRSNEQLNAISTGLAKQAMHDETEILAKLDASGGRILGIDDDKHITGITFADSQANDNTLVHVAKLPRLTKLDLRGTSVTSSGLNHLRGLTDLEELYLNSTDVADLQSVTHLKQLRLLELDYLELPTDELLGLQRLENLQELSLHVVKSVDDDTLKMLGRLTQLQTLRLSGSSITDTGLEHLATLSDLRILGLSSTGISDSGVKHIAKLEKLEQLWLGYTNVTDTGVAELANMPALFNLHLDHTTVTDTSIDHLLQIPKLWHVDLRNTTMTADGIRRLRASAPDLRHIDL